MTWTDHLVDGQWPVTVADERADRLEIDSYGGFVWFDEACTLTRVELVEEAGWLLDGGVHPLMVCQVLGKRAKSLYMAAHRVGDERVARAFARYEINERKAS